MTISHSPLNTEPFANTTPPISTLYMDLATYQFFREQSQPYLLQNPTSSLSNFLNDLPLLPNQSFHQIPNRIPLRFPKLTKRPLHLTIQSASAYISLAATYDLPVPPSVDTDVSISIFLQNVALGHIYPTLYPTTFTTPTTSYKVSLSNQAIVNLQHISESFSTSMYKSVSRYLALLAEQNIQLLNTKPSTTIIDIGNFRPIEVDQTPPRPDRPEQYALELPLTYLNEQALQHGITAPRRNTDITRAGMVVEYLGLGWLTPERMPTIG